MTNHGKHVELIADLNAQRNANMIKTTPYNVVIVGSLDTQAAIHLSFLRCPITMDVLKIAIEFVDMSVEVCFISLKFISGL